MLLTIQTLFAVTCGLVVRRAGQGVPPGLCRKDAINPETCRAFDTFGSGRTSLELYLQATREEVGEFAAKSHLSGSFTCVELCYAAVRFLEGAVRNMALPPEHNMVCKDRACDGGSLLLPSTLKWVAESTLDGAIEEDEEVDHFLHGLGLRLNSTNSDGVFVEMTGETTEAKLLEYSSNGQDMARQLSALFGIYPIAASPWAHWEEEPRQVMQATWPEETECTDEFDDCCAGLRRRPDLDVHCGTWNCARDGSEESKILCKHTHRKSWKRSCFCPAEAAGMEPADDEAEARADREALMEVLVKVAATFQYYVQRATDLATDLRRGLRHWEGPADYAERTQVEEALEELTAKMATTDASAATVAELRQENDEIAALLPRVKDATQRIAVVFARLSGIWSEEISSGHRLEGPFPREYAAPRASERENGRASSLLQTGDEKEGHYMEVFSTAVGLLTTAINRAFVNERTVSRWLGDDDALPTQARRYYLAMLEWLLSVVPVPAPRGSCSGETLAFVNVRRRAAGKFVGPERTDEGEPIVHMCIQFTEADVGQGFLALLRAAGHSVGMVDQALASGEPAEGPENCLRLLAENSELARSNVDTYVQLALELVADRRVAVPVPVALAVAEQKSERIPEQKSERIPEQKSERIPEQKSEVPQDVTVPEPCVDEIPGIRLRDEQASCAALKASDFCNPANEGFVAKRTREACKDTCGLCPNFWAAHKECNSVDVDTRHFCGAKKVVVTKQWGLGGKDMIADLTASDLNLRENQCVRCKWIRRSRGILSSSEKYASAVTLDVPKSTLSKYQCLAYDCAATTTPVVRM